MTYSPETQAILDRIIAKTRRSAWSATWWYLGTGTVTGLMCWKLRSQWAEWQWLFGVFGVILAAMWVHFLLTVYRIRKGYFGSNEQEAREIIAEIHSN